MFCAPDFVRAPAQDTILGERFDPRHTMWTNFAFILSGVVAGVSLGVREGLPRPLEVAEYNQRRN